MKNKHSLIILSILLLAFLYACNDANEQLPEFPITENIKVEYLINSPFMGRLSDMKITKNHIYISDSHDEKLITDYNLNNHKSFMFGNKGQGPDDINPPCFLSVNGEKLYAYSAGIFKFGYFNAIKDTAYSYNFICKMPMQVSQVLVLANDRYLVSGYFEKGRYAIINDKGEIIKVFGKYPNYGDNEDAIPYSAKAMFHQVKFAVDDSKKKLVAKSRCVMDIIDFSDSCRLEKRILLNKYSYTYSSGETIYARRAKDDIKGAIGVACSKSFIYILFDPNKDSDTEKLNNEIWIFDWNAKPIKKLSPNKNIRMISSNSDKIIYGISDEEEPKLVKINVD